MNHTEFLARVTAAFEKPVLATIPLSLAIGQFIAANALWQQVADRSGISRRSLQRSFNGRSKPSMDTIMLVLNLLGVNFRPVATEMIVNLSAATADATEPVAVTADVFDLKIPAVRKFVLIISEQVGLHEREVRPSSTIDTLGADSLDMVEILLALEDGFEVDIPDPDPALGIEYDTVTMKDLFDHVQNCATVQRAQQ